ncbi:hypothetical protein R3I94_000958 [Phoxinus phoxinus]
MFKVYRPSTYQHIPELPSD